MLKTEIMETRRQPGGPAEYGKAVSTRGTGGTGTYYDPDRLKAPLIRKNERGKEEWVEVTWDEALTLHRRKNE